MKIINKLERIFDLLMIPLWTITIILHIIALLNRFRWFSVFFIILGIFVYSIHFKRWKKQFPVRIKVKFNRRLKIFSIRILHQCKHCGVWTSTPDKYCYANPINKCKHFPCNDDFDCPYPMEKGEPNCN